ncbi:hypothetical protein AGMMS4952_00670 [Spirochaetia bacterium]|nr:hypothetical protein AGMMS4952_00670 [Spirochaetia bacterium]
MKNMARLVLFFSLSFIIIFTIAGTVSYLQLALEAARTIPAGPPVKLRQFVAVLQRILPLTLYITILMGLSYTARRGIPLPAAIIGVFILAGGSVLGSTLGFLNLKSMDSEAAPLVLSGVERKTLGDPGLILSQGDMVVVLLGDPEDAASPRVISFPERPLIYQELPVGPNNTIAALPPAPFRIEESYLMNGILTDSALVSEQFGTRMNAGLIPFAIYTGALIFLLASLRFVMDLSSWPLANLFSGAMVFRGILAFQTFIDDSVIQDFLLAFVNGRIEASFLSPIIFTGLAVLILLYTFLVNLARGRLARKHFPRGRARRPDRRQEHSEPYLGGPERRQGNRQEAHR